MRIDADRDALIVADLQRDFMPGGALPVAEGDVIAPPIGRLAPRFHTVVAIQDWHPPGHVSFASAHPGRRPYERIPLYGGEQTLWPDHCVQGSPGARLHDALADAHVSLILRKGTRREVESYSAFRENPGPDGGRLSTGLAALLEARGIRRVVVVGLARDFCVKLTALDAAAAGFDAVVIDDLTRAIDPAGTAAVDAALHEGGVARITSGALE